MKPLFLVVVAAAAALLAARPAAGSPLRVWTDRSGVVHVDDFGPPEPRPAHRRATRAARPVAVTPAPARATPIVPGLPVRSDAPPDAIEQAAQKYNVPAELVRAVIAAESYGNAAAVSHKGAIGLMQLMPATAGEMYVDDPIDPKQNIDGGTRYLRQLANRFGGDMILTIAAYNAGPDAVRRYGRVPPYAETQDYVRKVMTFYRAYKRQRTSPQPRLASASDAADRRPESRP